MNRFGMATATRLARGLAMGCGVLLLTALPVLAAPDRLIDSNEYKDKDFRKGCIDDYQELAEGDQIRWAWIAPGVKLADYKLSIAAFKDLSDELSKSQLDEVRGTFEDFFGRLDGTKGSLKAEVCLYTVEKFSAGKAWIPFVGGHQMQAGVGAEVVITGSDGKPVARIRHFAREGARIEDAANEVAGDLRKFISRN